MGPMAGEEAYGQEESSFSFKLMDGFMLIGLGLGLGSSLLGFWIRVSLFWVSSSCILLNEN